MTTDNDTTTTTDPALRLRSPGTGKKFYRPSPGQYIGEFVRWEEAVDSKFPYDDGSPKPQMLWVWKLTNLDGSVVLNDEGEQAEGDKFTTLSTGSRSNNAQFFEAHGRPLVPGDNMAQARDEIIGKKVQLLYVQAKTEEGQLAMSPEGRKLGKLSMVMAYDG